MLKTPSLLSVGFALIARDIKVAHRQRAACFLPLMFAMIFVMLVALGLNGDATKLQQIAPAAIWLAILFSSLLAAESLFKADYEEGSMQALALSSYPSAFLLLTKIIAHWLVSALPLILFSPLLAFSLNLPSAALPALVFSLLLGTPCLSLLLAIMVALTAGLPRGGLLLILLVVPFCVPVMIFGVAIITRAAAGLSISAPLALLAALLLLSICFAPFASAGALKISLEQ